MKRTLGRLAVAMSIVASALAISPALTTAAAAAGRCTASPSQNEGEARNNFENECGRAWDESRPDVCDYSHDGYRCSGIDDRAEALQAPVIVHSIRTGNEVSLVWNPVPGAVSYDIHRDGEYVTTIRADQDTSFWEQGVHFLYHYSVTAVNADGNTAKSEKVVAWAGGNELKYLSTQPVGGGQYKIIWPDVAMSTHLPVTYKVFLLPGRREVVSTSENEAIVKPLPGQKYVVEAHFANGRPTKVSAPVIPLEHAPDEIYAITGPENSVALIWNNSSARPLAQSHAIFENGRQIATVDGGENGTVVTSSGDTAVFQVAAIDRGEIGAVSVPVAVSNISPNTLYAARGVNPTSDLASVDDILDTVYEDSENNFAQNVGDLAVAAVDISGAAAGWVVGLFTGTLDDMTEHPGRDELAPPDQSLDEQVNEFLEDLDIHDHRVPSPEELAEMFNHYEGDGPLSPEGDLSAQEHADRLQEARDKFFEDILDLAESLDDRPTAEDLLPVVEDYLENLNRLGIPTKRVPYSGFDQDNPTPTQDEYVPTYTFTPTVDLEPFVTDFPEPDLTCTSLCGTPGTSTQDEPDPLRTTRRQLRRTEIRSPATTSTDDPLTSPSASRQRSQMTVVSRE